MRQRNCLFAITTFIAFLPSQKPDDPSAKASAFLLKNQEDGRFFFEMPARGPGGKARKFFDPGLTGLCLAALQTRPEARRSAAEKQAIEKGITWLLGQQSKVGSFGRRNLIYSTSSAVLALSSYGGPKVKTALERAKTYLRAAQMDESRGLSKSDRDYGAFNYGSDERGDLSNTQFAIHALRASGLEGDAEELQKALVFLQRLQNRKKSNDLDLEKLDQKSGEKQRIRSGNDGGATYYPGTSPAGFDKLADGTLVPRSYGSMTYALLKTYIFCGLDGEDPRVKAAIDWVSKNWTVSQNPGFPESQGPTAPYQGLFYYYMAMSQALHLAGVKQLQAAGKEDGKVDWRGQLHAQLSRLQKDDGRFVNDRNDRWYEGMPVVATAYAMLALQHCRPTK